VACSRRTTEILNGSDRSPFDAQGTVADHLIKSVVYADHIRMAGVEVPHTRLGDFNGQGQLIEKKIHEQSSHGFFYVRVKMLTQRGDRALRHPQFFRLPIPLFHPSSVTKEHVITGHAEPFLKTLATFINAPNLPTGVYPTVCFDAGLIGHEALWGHLASAGYLPNDECSAMPPRGAQVFTIPITIYDDPTLKNAMGSYRFDAEGEPGRRTRLVHNGNFEHFLTDRQSAGFLGVQNNGHSRIEFYDPVDEESNYFSDGLPQSKVAEVRTSNTVLECPQTITLSEMRREAKKIARGRGLDFYVELLQANGGDVDISSGAVTGNHVLAYTVDVRTGRKKPVRGVNLSGNSQDILLSIVGVGENPIVRHGQCLSESGTIPVTESSPPLLSRGLPYKQVVTIAKDPLEPGKKYHHF
jgi:predicted Zn-dependent protease